MRERFRHHKNEMERNTENRTRERASGKESERKVESEREKGKCKIEATRKGR